MGPWHLGTKKYPYEMGFFREFLLSKMRFWGHYIKVIFAGSIMELEHRFAQLWTRGIFEAHYNYPISHFWPSITCPIVQNINIWEVYPLQPTGIDLIVTNGEGGWLTLFHLHNFVCYSFDCFIVIVVDFHYYHNVEVIFIGTKDCTKLKIAKKKWGSLQSIQT